ncbi:MAG: HipA domain-containing protein [Alphaproteobacteria bacterium]|nr:HipA domain-containing protein [Alphaproteobacteria bacterium]
MNRKLNVYLYGKLIGILSENNLGHLEFQYSENAYPISVRMPVTCDKYDETFTEPFFDNLTPEGNALDLIINLFRISKGNTFSVLNKIGGDCAGAISLYTNEPQNNIDNPLIEINENSLSKIIEELPNNPLLTSLKKAPRLSLAGVQSKFALHKGIDGKYYRSDENNPTTHIIKIANDRFENLLENELFCMKLSKTIFKDAINVELKTIKNNKFLEIERYDRKYINNKVERIHQEDFCQVLGYLSKNKYQIEKGPKISQIYNAIYKYSNQKLNDGYKFIKLLIFNYLIGNSY